MASHKSPPMASRCIIFLSRVNARVNVAGALTSAAGIAASHLPGLDLIPAVAMGIGAMCTVMLTLPLTATMLATLLLGSDGIQVMPVVIVAVVVAYVVTARITPPKPADDQRLDRPANAPTTTPMTVTK